MISVALRRAIGASRKAIVAIIHSSRALAVPGWRARWRCRPPPPRHPTLARKRNLADLFTGEAGITVEHLARPGMEKNTLRALSFRSRLARGPGEGRHRPPPPAAPATIGQGLPGVKTIAITACGKHRRRGMMVSPRSMFPLRRPPGRRDGPRGNALPLRRPERPYRRPRRDPEWPG